MATVHTPSMEPATVRRAFDVERVRRDFPILEVRHGGRPIVYLDNAATTQKPRHVIETIQRYYTRENANIHRGVHYLSQVATDHYERAREQIARFLGATVGCEIVFTRGATEGINLIAQTYGRKFIGPGDEILISHMEHHSNIVPWQMLCEEKGSKLRVVPITDDGELDMDAFGRLLNARTKIVSIGHVSNALGTVNPVRAIIDAAHAAGAIAVVDGAQSAPHMPVNIHAMGCDFFVCSGHKMYGPTGIGVLYGKVEHLEKMPPYQGGGDMVLSVTFEKTTFNILPHKYEAGTPHIEGVIGLGATVDYLNDIGMDAIAEYEQNLTRHGTQLLEEIPGLRLIGTARDKAGILSFTLDGVHPHDIGQLLDEDGVAIRVGHHCAQPVMQRFGVPATARASLAFYNTKEELDTLAAGIRRVQKVFA
ncbi:MAG TPA: cysteine desulfurase [Candidatus Hydrogenedentes bacterium]|nr:cysteine desulfurase [Candidatus Hydrogenedentota bacterium]